MKNLLFKQKVFPAFFLVFIIYGCTSANITLDVKHGAGKENRTALPYQKTLTVFFEPVTGMDESVWFKKGKFSSKLGKSPSVYVKDAFKKELPFWGINITEDLKKADGIIKVDIRWFGPYGNSPNSAAVILAVSLFEKNTKKTLWHGKVEGGVLPEPLPAGQKKIRITIEDTIDEALSEAMTNLRWSGEFNQAIAILEDSE